jgi:hypothetical protein
MTPRSPAPEVWGRIEDLGFKIELDSQVPVAPLVPLSLVISPSTYDTKYNFKTFPHYNLANNFLPNYEILASATLMKWPH